MENNNLENEMTAEELLKKLKLEKQGTLSMLLWASTAIAAMEEYSHIRTSSLSEEIEKLKAEKKEILGSTPFVRMKLAEAQAYDLGDKLTASQEETTLLRKQLEEAQKGEKIYTLECQTLRKIIEAKVEFINNYEKEREELQAEIERLKSLANEAPTDEQRLRIFEDLQFTFRLQSDYSCTTNGYRVIEKEIERLKSRLQENTEPSNNKEI